MNPNQILYTEVLKGNSKILPSVKDNDLSLSAETPNNEINVSLFPKTRFYGSKRRLTPWLYRAFSSLKFDHCLDAFGGTATVSLLMKALNKEVTFNDALQCKVLSAEALLSNEPVKLNSQLIDSLLSFDKNTKGKVSNLYEDIFYTESENAWLDSFVDASKNITNHLMYAELHYCLFQACLQKRPFNLFHRKNLNIRTSCSKETKFGNWRTWERSFEELIIRASGELKKARSLKNKHVNILGPMDASEINPGSYDLVYVDPPYVSNTKNELTYMDRYHFLEGLLNYDNWELMIDNSRKFKPLLSSPAFTEWNKKDKFKDRLYGFINTHKQSTVALSYIANAYPDQDELVKHFKDNFKHVIVFSQALPHALSKKEKIEILITGQN